MEEEIELRLTFWGDIEDMPTWQWGLEQWEEKAPNVKIMWENTPWGEYWTKLQTEMAGGTSPDVVGMVSMYSMWYIRNDTLLPMDPFIENSPDIDMDDFWPAVMAAYTDEGQTYALPYDLSTMCMFYNKSLFDEAGVAYPVEWTWEEFLDAAQKMTKDTSGDGKIDQFGYLLPSFDWTIDVPLGTNGTSLVSDDRSKCLLDTPEAIETIQWLADLRLVHHVAPTIGEAGDIPMWETGKAAITWGNPEAVQVMSTRVGPPRDNDKFLWDVCLFPKKVKNANALHGGSFSIGKATPYGEQAWEFTSFYTSSDILREMVAKPSRGIPGRRSCADALLTDVNPEHQQLYLDVLDYEGMECRWIVPYQEVMDLKTKYVDQVFLGESTAEEAMPKAVAEIDPVLAEWV
jgi:multiple sugar transport system substrate-binding protein